MKEDKILSCPPQTPKGALSVRATKRSQNIFKAPLGVWGCIAFSLLTLFACHHRENNTGLTGESSNNTPAAIVPDFNADSAYSFTKQQVKFGPRIPGTKAHQNCLDFIYNELVKDSLHPIIQRTKARTFDGKHYEIENIIAMSQPQKQARILLCTHWDTRPWADMDSTDSSKQFDGADDGASGAAVLLEIARHLSAQHSTSNTQNYNGLGVDLVFFDLEDYGQQEGVNDEDVTYPTQENTWCLGSQYWANNLPPSFIEPRYGILLDMVGGKNAVFPQEGTSLQYAPNVVEEVWKRAEKLGYGNYFTRDQIIKTIDDHKYINEIARIPTIDIVHYVPEKHDYPYFHHKHSDNMDVIDKSSMKVVGNLLLNLIYADNNNRAIP